MKIIIIVIIVILIYLYIEHNKKQTIIDNFSLFDIPIVANESAVSWQVDSKYADLFQNANMYIDGRGELVGTK